MSRPAYPGDPVFEVIGLRLAALERDLADLRRQLGISAPVTGYQPDDEPLMFDDGNGCLRETRRP